MAPKKKFPCSVVVFDVNVNDSFKEAATQAYLDICGENFFCTDIICSQLILINTEETNNKKNDQIETKFLNIVESTDMVQWNPKNIKYIEEARPSSGNWLEGVLLAVEELLTSFKSGSFEGCRLIILSDLSTPLKMGDVEIERTVKSIIKQVCQMDAYIYFLGPGIELPNMLESKQDIYSWVQNMKIDEGGPNMQIAKRILTECTGVMSDLLLGVDLVQSYVPSKKGFPFLEPLMFRDLEIQSSSVKFVESKSTLGFKKEVLTPPNKVFVSAEEQSEEVDADNVIAGIALHDKLVIIPNDVKKGIKEYNRFFKLLGFTDASRVPKDYMLASSTSIITTNDSKDPEVGAMNYIINACKDLNKYGIAIRAYMRNCRPKLYCLIPRVDPVCFVMVELPYAEDINVLYETGDCSTIKFKENAYSDYDDVETLKDNIYGYLDDINMNERVKLHPIMRENCSKRKINQHLTSKILDKEISHIPLPLGELYVTPTKDFYTAINANWMSRYQNKDESYEETL